ncbi:MAG: thioredoxin-like domain-containing protein, partial [Tepidiformaceae bacterium]
MLTRAAPIARGTDRVTENNFGHKQGRRRFSRRLSRAATIAACVLVMVAALAACSGGGTPERAPEDGGGGGGAPTPPGGRESWAGTQAAPEFPGGQVWFNVERPLTLADLKGKMVLLDFWTQGCINCQHIIPDLKRLEEEFGGALAVIGVHSGKYSTEHEDETVREAIGRYGIEHPVINDPDFVVWRTYGANAWPTLVLIDPAGNLVGGHAGEGVYPLFQPILAALLAEFEGKIDETPLPLRLDASVASTVLSYPSKVLADERGGRLFIADAGHNRILVSDLDGRLERAIGTGAEGFADGAGEEATFRAPQGLGLSEDGETLYVADTRNHAVRAVELSSGRVTTIAGTGTQLDRMPGNEAKATETALASPWDVLPVGNRLFISMAGVHQIWVMNLESGEIAVFAGTSREGIQDGARQSVATLAQPSGLAADDFFLYWVDPESSSVRRVALAGETEGYVQTLVGTGLFDWGDEDGQGKAAKVQHPQGIAYEAGLLLIADTFNHKLKAIDAANFEVTTAAGTGEREWRDGPREMAAFDEPGGLSIAGTKVYVADTNNHLVRVLDLASGEVTTLTLTNLGVLGGAAGTSSRVDVPAQA